MQQASRVLLVDKETVRESLQLSLDGFGCEFGQAGTGAEALALLRKGQFDVTFLEVDLPDINGMQVLQQAREENLTPGEVVVLTSLFDPKDEVVAKQLKAFKYVEKPIEYEQTRALVSEATSIRAVAPSVPVIPIVAHPVESQSRNMAPVAPLYRILVLDDHEDWLQQIRESLGNEFEVVYTTDEDDACRWSNQEHFDLVVIERKLARDISGFEVLSVMRRAKRDLRATILSDFSDFKPLIDPRSAIGYVSKKDLATLPETIKRFLEHPIERKRVFLSYARADRRRVLQIYDALLTRGYLPWLDDKSIVPGKKWEAEIKVAIETSDFFVFCLSEESAVREGIVVKEINWALEKQAGLRDSRFIITARLEDAPLDLLLEPFQWVDLFGPQGMLKLLAALSATDGHPKAHAAPATLPRNVRPAASVRLADEPLRELLRAGESEQLEFKASLRFDLRSKKASKDLENVVVRTVSAFLNGYHGGVLLIGVNDDGIVLGLEDDYQTLKKKNRDGFQQHAFQLLMEAYGKDVASLIYFHFEECDGKDVCRVTVQPSLRPVYIGGHLYIRTGNATNVLSTEDAIRYAHQRWESSPRY